jgi:hypothetical protein
MFLDSSIPLPEFGSENEQYGEPITEHNRYLHEEIHNEIDRDYQHVRIGPASDGYVSCLDAGTAGTERAPRPAGREKGAAGAEGR